MIHHLSRVRGKDTRPEWIARSALHRLGFRFQLHRKDLPGKPDLVFPKYRAVLLVHGCFWHRHVDCKDASMPSSNQDFWIDKFSSTIRRDSEVLCNLQSLGWKTMVVWECELERDTFAAITKVVKWLCSDQANPRQRIDLANVINRAMLIQSASRKVGSRTKRYSTGEPKSDPLGAPAE
jgi:DNA mismatch endonuclease (patch repair protein)